MVLGRDLESVIWLSIEENPRIGMLEFLESGKCDACSIQ